MPTQLQKRTRDILVEDIANNRKPEMKSAMLRAGAKLSYANNSIQLTRSKGWKELMAQVQDDVLLEKLCSIALDFDKRSALSAIDMLLRLKDRYPASKHKLIPSMEERSEYVED